MKLTSKDIYDKKAKQEKIACLSLYDFPSARIADEAGIDVLVIGDSVGMTLLGHNNTLQMTMDKMIYHTQAVARAAKRALVVSDMPVNSFTTVEDAVCNAKQFIDEAGADAVKLEGGEKVKEQIEAVIKSGVAVVGHLGMLPQKVSDGKYRVYGRSEDEAKQLLNDVLLLEKLGAFAVVLECIPSSLGKAIAEKTNLPIIGIGAGGEVDGQVLVFQDVLGIRSSVRPRFVRSYADFEKDMRVAAEKYRDDVLSKNFPSEKESFS